MSNAQGSCNDNVMYYVSRLIDSVRSKVRSRSGHDWACIELMVVGGWWVRVLEEGTIREGGHEKMWLFRSMAEQGMA